MTELNGFDITQTRGDSMTLTVGMKKGNQTYIPVAGDSLRFALSIGYKGEMGYQLIKAVDIDTGTLTFTVDSEDTEKWVESEYNYDIELTYNDGTVDTFISGKVFMKGECE